MWVCAIAQKEEFPYTQNAGNKGTPAALSAISLSRQPLLSPGACWLPLGFRTDNEQLHDSVPCSCFYGCGTLPQKCLGT